jgi:hypothetical protein
MKYILEVTSRATPGRDADYNAWYDTTHVVDVLGLPGFNACQRYVRANPGAEGPTEYVAAYEVETDDPAALLESLMAAGPQMQMTDAIDFTSVRFDFLLPTGDRRT